MFHPGTVSFSTPTTLAGAPDAALHLAELTLGEVDRALCPLQPDAADESFLLLVCLPGAAARGRCLDQSWLLPPDSILWQHHPVPVHLRRADSAFARVLAWRFRAAALPAELAELLLTQSPGTRPLVGPRPLSAAEANLVLGLRSCPVAPALRTLWATAKLVELLTHLLPPPATPAPGSSPDFAGASSAAAAIASDPEPGSLPAPVRAALAYMESHLAEPIGLAELAAAAGQSPAHFSRGFSAALGHGPTAQLRRLRMAHAARLLSAGAANVTEAALATGYQSLGQFSRVFTEHHGRPPSAFLPRNNG